VRAHDHWSAPAHDLLLRDRRARQRLRQGRAAVARGEGQNTLGALVSHLQSTSKAIVGIAAPRATASASRHGREERGEADLPRRRLRLFRRLGRRRVHAGHAAREGFGRGCRPLSQDRPLAGAPVGSLQELDDVYADWRDRIALPRRHATGRFVVAERLEVERQALRLLPPVGFDAAERRSSRVPTDGYFKHAASSPARRHPRLPARATMVAWATTVLRSP
jgi:hypothetical protein